MSKQLKDLVHQLIPQEFQWKITLLANWQTIIGPLYDKVAIYTIQGNCLILEVSHPTWAQELLHLVPLIQHKVNTALQSAYIQNIRFKIAHSGRQFSQQCIKRASFTRSLKKKTEALYTLNNREEIALTSFKNEELKDAMRAFLIACKQS